MSVVGWDTAFVQEGYVGGAKIESRVAKHGSRDCVRRVRERTYREGGWL